MANPVPAANTVSGYVDRTRGLYTGELATTEEFLADGVLVQNRLNFILEVYYFDDVVTDADSWLSGIGGIQAVAWQGEDADADLANVSLTVAATGEITFQTSAGNARGWVWVLIDPAGSGNREGYPGR